MASGDGNGWVESTPGRRHWGRFGAAGLVLLRLVDVAGEPGAAAQEPGAAAQEPGAAAQGPGAAAQVLMQLRAGWTHEGGVWGVVGGARDSHESLAETALREAAEEADVDAGRVTVLGTQVGVDHGVWSYTYVIALAEPGLEVRNRTAESDAVRWVHLDDVPGLPLHAGLAATWPQLRPAVDAALAGVGRG